MKEMQMPTLLPTWLLDLIRCPITLEKLDLATPELTERLRSELKSGNLTNRIGTTVSDDFHTGLVNLSGTWFYPVVEEIPVLVPDEAISIAQ